MKPQLNCLWVQLVSLFHNGSEVLSPNFWKTRPVLHGHPEGSSLLSPGTSPGNTDLVSAQAAPRLSTRKPVRTGLGSGLERSALLDYLQEEKLSPMTNTVWVSEYGKALEPNGVFQALKSLGKRNGIPDLQTHRFRHTYAVNTLRAGMPDL